MLSFLPIADDSMDIILCSEVLEHIEQPPSAIEEIARILKPDGYALITTPNPANLVERMGYALDRLSGGGLKKILKWSVNRCQHGWKLSMKSARHPSAGGLDTAIGCANYHILVCGN